MWDILRQLEALAGRKALVRAGAGPSRRPALHLCRHRQAPPPPRLGAADRVGRGTRPPVGLAAARLEIDSCPSRIPCDARLSPSRPVLASTRPYDLPDCSDRRPPPRSASSTGTPLAPALPRLESYLLRDGPIVPLSRHPGWLPVLARGLSHTPYCLEAVEDGQDLRLPGPGRRQELPVRPVPGQPAVPELRRRPWPTMTKRPRLLIDQAVRLADDLGVRYLELRHEHPVAHPALKRRPDRQGPHAAGPAGHARQAVGRPRRQGPQPGPQGPEERPDRGLGRPRPSWPTSTPSSAETCATWGRRSTASACSPRSLEQFPDRAEFCVVRAGDGAGGRGPAAARLGRDRGAQRQLAAQPQPHLRRTC